MNKIFLITIIFIITMLFINHFKKNENDYEKCLKKEINLCYLLIN